MYSDTKNTVQLTVSASDPNSIMQSFDIIEEPSNSHGIFVEKHAISSLDQTRKSLQGIYVLLSHPSETHSFEAYIGKSITGLYNEVARHAGSSFWTKAFLLSTLEGERMTLNERSYLYNALMSAFGASKNITIVNTSRLDETFLDDAVMSRLDAMVVSALRMMAFSGYRVLGDEQELSSTASSLSKALNASPELMKTDATKTTPTTSKVMPPTLPKPVKPQFGMGIRDVATNKQDSPTQGVSTPGATPVNSSNEEVYSRLAEWRKEKAKHQEVPAYIVFSNKDLHSIADRKPLSAEELIKVPGIGEHKMKLYGQELLKLLAAP